MAKRILAVLFMLGIFCFSITALAMEPDARSYAMGGAYTAVVKDASAVYWNPAMLPYIRYTSLVLGGGVASEDFSAFTGAMDAAMDELDIDVKGQFGLMAALATRWVGLALYGDMNMDVKAQSTVDEADPLSSGATGNAVVETRGNAALATAKRFDHFSLGLAVKVVGDGWTKHDLKSSVEETESGGELVTELPYTQIIGTGISSDLAFATSFTDRLRLGVVVQDIFSSLEYKEEKYEGDTLISSSDPYSGKLDPILRAGVAFEPGFGFTLAGDVTSEGQIGLGLEKNLFWNGLSLRGGYVSQDDLQEYRAGLGLNLLWLHLDLGVGMSPEKGLSGAMLSASLTF